MTITKTPEEVSELLPPEYENKIKEIEAQIYGTQDKKCTGGCSEGEDEKKEGCPDYAPDESRLNPVGRLLVDGFYNALEVCFDELSHLRDAPKNILIIGGCRQRDMARRLGFLLPFSKIYTLDPDEAEVQRAEVEIKCRFKFTHGAVEALPFEDKAIDLTLAHNAFEYISDWDKATQEIQRVTRHHALIGFHRPVMGQLLSRFPGMTESMTHLGCKIPDTQPSKTKIIQKLQEMSAIKTTVHPLPWQLMMCKIK